MPLSKVQSGGISLADNFTFTGTVSGVGSNIKERLAMLCDGQNYTVPSGTYTPTNVTAGAGTSNTFAELNGSKITYTAPSGTTAVLYEFIFHTSAHNAQHGILSVRLAIDGTEVTDSRTHIGSNSALGVMQNFSYVIPIGGSASAATGRQASWSSGKELKLELRRHSSSNEMRVHNTYYYNGSVSAQFHRPSLIITSFG